MVFGTRTKHIYVKNIIIIIMLYEDKPKLVHVQSVLKKDDVDALKKKAHESSVKEALAKAVYHYLNCVKT